MTTPADETDSDDGPIIVSESPAVPWDKLETPSVDQGPGIVLAPEWDNVVLTDEKKRELIQTCRDYLTALKARRAAMTADELAAEDARLEAAVEAAERAAIDRYIINERKRIADWLDAINQDCPRCPPDDHAVVELNNIIKIIREGNYCT